MNTYLFPPPPVAAVPVRGHAELFPVNRLFFVGRNYHAHAVEMGKPVDKSVERPFYFTKAPQTLALSGATTPYPSETANYHFEMELVLAIGKPGFRVKAEDAHEIIYGYAAGLDMTRRDLQLVAQQGLFGFHPRAVRDVARKHQKPAIRAGVQRQFLPDRMPFAMLAAQFNP